jgi:UDPglucose 6-dehydrogenase
MTYKQGATTLEHSLPLKVAKQMASLGATIHVYDPLIEKELTEAKETKDFSVFSDPYNAVVNAHAVICITPWPEIKKLDFKKMAESMQTPKILFDARNFFLSDKTSLTQSGMMYVRIGRKIGIKTTV